MKYTEGYLLDNRYQLERFIGSGTFGEVWVAIDKGTDIRVAVKVYVSMDEKGILEFKKEFQISFELNHTNLLHANYLGVNPEDKRPYLVMPFCPEGSVSRFAGEMSEADIWRFIRDVASGLAYLHSKQPPIIHQDIKPDNILIVKNGDFVITDFGISKQLRATLRKSANSLNSAGAISYMGPERFSKQYQAIKASDIWSLGVSIFELATNELPFCGMGGSLLKQGADMPELPEQFSETLNMVCQSCMAKEPWNRPTAQQLADFASKYIDGADPVPAWIKTEPVESKDEKTQVKEETSVKKEGQPDVPAVEQPENKKLKSNSTIAVSSPAASSPKEVSFSAQESKGKTVFPAGVWIAVAGAGLILGFILNYFM